MTNLLNKEIRKLQAISDMLMYIEGEPVPRGTSYLLDDIAQNLREITSLFQISHK